MKKDLKNDVKSFCMSSMFLVGIYIIQIGYHALKNLIRACGEIK